MSAGASSRAAATRDALLRAALDEFSAFGYRRSSMEGVARRAEVSRATLYLHWARKEELFRALVTRLHDSHIDAMRQAAARPAGFEPRLLAVLEARFGRWVELTAASPHAAELYDLHGRLCGDIARAAQVSSERLLARLLRDADRNREIDLGRAGLSAPRAAGTLLLCAHGAKGEDPSLATPEEFSLRLREIVRLLMAGLATRP